MKRSASVFAGAFVAAAAALGSMACDDDPWAVRWVSDVDTVGLYALSRPESNLVSAYDFVPRLAVRIEAPSTGGSWDLAVDYRNQRFVWLLPPALGIDSQAGLATMEGETFESVLEAPADTARYASDVPVPIVLGQLYVIRTRQHPGVWGQRCNYYGKVEPLATNSATGAVHFRFDMSRACNDRDLIPPD